MGVLNVPGSPLHSLKVEAKYIEASQPPHITWYGLLLLAFQHSDMYVEYGQERVYFLLAVSPHRKYLTSLPPFLPSSLPPPLLLASLLSLFISRHSTQPPLPIPRSTSPRSLAAGNSMGGGGGGMVQPASYSAEMAAIPMSEVVRQLDFAANENMRLRDQLKQNNEILDSKLQEIETLLRQRDTHTQRKLRD